MVGGGTSPSTYRAEWVKLPELVPFSADLIRKKRNTSLIPNVRVAHGESPFDPILVPTALSSAQRPFTPESSQTKEAVVS